MSEPLGDKGREPTGRAPTQAAASPLERALARARWALAWERAWPPLAGIFAVAGLFLIASWSGLWPALPAAARIAGLGLLGILALAAAFPLLRFRFPTSAAALDRLDRQSGITHRPATAIADRIAAGREDAGSVALWRAHLVRAAASAGKLRAGWPAPGLARRDPYALRALVLLLAVGTFFAAGSDRFARLRSAFDWNGVVAGANYRVDSWITPPNYTGKPPILLPGIRAGEPIPAANPLAVPSGSVLVVRGSGLKLDLIARGLAETAAEGGNRAPTGSEERRFTITEAGALTLRGLGREVTWIFTAIPDRAPTIALAKDPEGQARGTLALSYRLEDDYGVAHAEAQFALKLKPDPATKAARPLYDAPNFPLSLPQSRARNAVGQTTKDLTQHPWAGAEVTMTLLARDEAENEGRSEPHGFKLPERPFYKPLARALIEQRRTLALDGEARGRVLRALEALTIAPERFTPEASVFLGLRSIFWQLTGAKSDDHLRDVVDRLWAMAVSIEDGTVSDAEQALRAAQDALRQALERGASDEELKRLMDQLRAALDKFMQAMADELRKNPQQLARPLDPNARELRMQDLQSMLDRLENLARSGAKDAAKQLLEQLQAMLDNLQMAQPGQGDGDDMNSALDELGDMIRKEQQLRDRTFQQGQNGRRERGQRGQQGQRGQRGQQGQQGQEGQDGQGQGGLGELRQGQQALRDKLAKMLEQLRGRGQGQQGQQGQGGQGDELGDALGRAEQAMRDAESALGDGDAEGAVDAQGRAIESMRKGAQNLAQQMQQGGPGQGPNGQPGRTGPARAQQDTDPLGRPLRGRDFGDDVSVKIPGEIEVQRARRILEELRRRVGDPMRPQLELEYLERLLKGF